MTHLHSPAADRNRDPILNVLRTVFPDQGLVLEIASGTGQHAVHMAAHLPGLTWQPTDADDAALASIAAYARDAALPNLRAPRRLDVVDPVWGFESDPDLTAILCCNMIHIAPWEATLGLFAGAARVLPPGGLIALYGPFKHHGAFNAPSNEAFDASLRARNAAWGIRDLADVNALAATHGLHAQALHPMPANNHTAIFRRA